MIFIGHKRRCPWAVKHQGHIILAGDEGIEPSYTDFKDQCLNHLANPQLKDQNSFNRPVTGLIGVEPIVSVGFAVRIL